MRKMEHLKKNELTIGAVIFLATLMLMHTSLPLISAPELMPDYCVAFSVALIASNFLNLNLLKVFILGLISDILVGDLIGQYALIFIIVYFSNFIFNKYLFFTSARMIFIQHLILLLIAELSLFMTSISYQLDKDYSLYGIKIILTLLICLVYQKLFQYLKNKN